MTHSFSDAFRDRSVFVTGHTGFKGSWLVLWLHRLGARVTGYALAPPTDPSNFVVSGVGERLSAHHEADIRDAERLSAALDASGADVVFHLAAQSLVRTSYDAPHETFDVNVMGVARLLDAVRAAGRPCVVVAVTSDKCYENREQVWGYRECDPPGGGDPYSASKGAAEILVASYRRSFFPPERVSRHGVKLATARAGNVIGGGDWARDRIVADAVKALSAGRPVGVRNPDAIRPWQHVLEPLGGYLQLAAAMLRSDDPALCEAWNFGPLPGDERPVRKLADALIAAWGGGSWERLTESDPVPERRVLRLNIDKAMNGLGWAPRWRFAEAVRRTAAWHRAYHEGADGMAAACEADIEAYEAAADPGGGA